MTLQKFALVKNGTTVLSVGDYDLELMNAASGLRWYSRDPDNQIAESDHARLAWLPYVNTVPTFNPDTEKLSAQTTTIQATQVLVTATVIALTSTEQDAVKVQRVTDMEARAAFQILFRLWNEVLVLKGQAQITQQAFKNAVKNLL